MRDLHIGQGGLAGPPGTGCDSLCNISSRALHTRSAHLNMVDETNRSGADQGQHPDHFVAEWRAYRGLTQTELGKVLGVSHSKISRIETGETELKAGFLRKLARHFNIPPVAVLTVNPQGEGRQTAEMLDLWAAIEPRNRDAALMMLRGLRRTNGDRDAG